MFRKMIDALKVKDIRHRLGYVLLCLVIIRIGSQIPVPGVNSSYFKEWFASQAGDAFNFFDAFTGGSFSSMSILALSITPYITASIIIELLTIAIPALEEMQRDGEDGRKKMVAITRYVTVGLSLFESIAMTVGFGRQGLITDINFLRGVAVVVALTAGSCFLMWIGEQITEKGVGNGISIVLLINIVSRLPQDLTSLYEQFIKGFEQTKNFFLTEEKILDYASAYINALSHMDAYTLIHPDYNYQFEAEFFSSRTEAELSAFDWRCALAPREELQWRQVLLLGYAYLDQVCHVSKDDLKYYFSDPMYQILPSGVTRWRIGMPMALHYLDRIRLPEDYDIYIDTKDAHLLSWEKN